MDDTLLKTLRMGYKEDLKSQIELPKIHEFPFAVIYGKFDMLLLWASTMKDFEAWTKAFKELIPEPRKEEEINNPAELSARTKKSTVLMT